MQEGNGLSNKRHIELILDASGDGIYGVDRNGLAIFVNPAAVRMCGYTPEEMIGRSPHELTHHSFVDGRHYPASDCPVYAAFRDGKIHRVDHEVFWRKDGTCFPVEYVSTPIIDEGEIVGAVLSFRDISRRKAAEDALSKSRERERELQSDLHHASRISAMDQMASGIAHDLNQPLTAILANLSAAKMHLADGNGGENDTALQLMEKAAAQAKRAAEIIRGIRQFVLKDDGTKSEEDISEVIQEAIELASFGSRDKETAITFVCQADLPLASIEKIRIQQVLVNLIRNAVEAIDRQSGGRVEVLANTYSGGVEIAVRDNGPGISPDIKGCLFESFVTSKETGMGLGLSICRSIVEAHEGKLAAEANEAGTGMTFRFTLPIQQVSEF
ncbi:ATP-binding protein [Parasphingorhabdus sp.]|uniref:sensor histidine kinase n=1 Tax=Parasphingorhabdus sp. TaxID=2709688 RepID=UPI0032EF5774